MLDDLHATVWSPGGDVAFVTKSLEIRPD